jgi:hypothetical protein
MQKCGGGPFLLVLSLSLVHTLLNRFKPGFCVCMGVSANHITGYSVYFEWATKKVINLQFSGFFIVCASPRKLSPLNFLKIDDR